jgi:hypoxia up-regulated 1
LWYSTAIESSTSNLANTTYLSHNQVLVERHYPHVPIYNETRSGTYISVDKHDYTAEELIAMVLIHAKDITKAYGEEKGSSLGNIKDVVLTVPCFATQHERMALLDAAALADLNVLALIDETTAAALQYGMDKIEETPKIIVFYNLGAFSLQVSVVKFLSYQFKESKYAKNKTVGGFEVLGKAWDSTFGGQAVDQVIVDHLATEFNKLLSDGDDVRTNARAMAKLRLQANKVKHVLSANSEIPIYIDALHKDLALSSHMSRVQLEQLCHDMMARAVTPITTALAMANVTADQIDGIELIGGGMRVPKVQEEITKLLKVELGLHINSDESMALGAAFHGANISTAFKVRHVGMADINPFPVAISLNNIVETETEEKWSKQATMFKANGKVGVKKTIAFTHDQDVHCAIDYEDSEILPEGTPYVGVTVLRCAGISCEFLIVLTN